MRVQTGTVAPQPVRVRRSDLDPAGHVTAMKLFELFQEARILLFSRELGGITPGRFVVGHVEVALGAPTSWRAEPYDVRAWISRIGASSLTLDAQLVDGDEVLSQSRSVMVGFDLQTQRSRRLDDEERERLESVRPQA